ITASSATCSRWCRCSRRSSRSCWRSEAGRVGDMNIQLTDEQRMIQAVARDFAAKEVRPIAEAIDRDARVPHDTVRRMGELGLLGILVPEAYGGSDGDTVAYAVALEEVAKACASHAVIMSVNNSLYCDPVQKYGTEEQKRRFLVPFAKGERL